MAPLTSCGRCVTAEEGAKHTRDVAYPSQYLRLNYFECTTSLDDSCYPLWALGGVPREQKKLKGHLPRVIYHQVYYYTEIIHSILVYGEHRVY